MNILMRSVLLAAMMAGGVGLVACNSGTDNHPITPGDTGPRSDTGADTPVITDTSKDVGPDTNPGTDADTGVDILPDVSTVDPEAVQFLDPTHPPIDGEVIVGTLALPTGPDTFKYVSYWADPNEADWINPVDQRPGFHAYDLFPTTEMAARSHDKTMWAYSSGTSMDYGARLLVVDQDGKKLHTLKDNTLYQDLCKEYMPEFSPDDQWVYYWRSCNIRTSDFPSIVNNMSFEFRARVTPQGTSDDVQPFVAKNILDPANPGTPSQMLFGHLSEDGKKFFAKQTNAKSSVQSVIYSIDTETMLGTKVVELVPGFDTATTGPGFIFQYVLPGSAGDLYFTLMYSARRAVGDPSYWYMAKMTSDGKVNPVFQIPMDSSLSAGNFGYSISPVSLNQLTFIGTTRYTPAGKILEMGIGTSGIDGTGVKYSDKRGISGRWTSWNP